MTTAAQPLVFRMEHDGATIARALRRRDPAILEHLIERYQHRLYRYLLYLTSRPETAEDLFQDTWIRVLERGSQYNGKTKFEAWLFAIARHLVIDLARRKRMASLDALSTTTEGEDRPFEIEDATQISAMAKLLSEEQGNRISSSLDRLDALYREVLVLRFHEDLKLEEIAEIIDVPLSTVKSRLYRGLAALKPMLKGERA
jgi:RNA polymerase sigma-70 factor, ECF subfamily